MNLNSVSLQAIRAKSEKLKAELFDLMEDLARNGDLTLEDYLLMISLNIYDNDTTCALVELLGANYPESELNELQKGAQEICSHWQRVHFVEAGK